MRLIINAVNIHQGGGRTLLTALISALKQPTTIFIDSRFDALASPSLEVTIINVKPKFFDRLRVEFQLKKLAQQGDIVLCLGNLPPLLKSQGNVFVYLQNRYLCTLASLEGFSWKTRMRIITERLWLRLLLRDATIIVQTLSMEHAVKAYLGKDSLIIPFFSSELDVSNHIEQEKIYDFLYVASGEPHKNHHQLLQAWILLSKKGIRPSLCLTLDESKDVQTLRIIENLKSRHGLKIFNKHVPSQEISVLYLQSRVLIYPSLLESFGLPLLEASKYGLPVLASERDYVRDVINPEITFDPESPLSIARAVQRKLNVNEDIPAPNSPENFLAKIADYCK